MQAPPTHSPGRLRHAPALLAALIAALAVALGCAQSTPAKSLQDKLDAKRAHLEDAKHKKGVLTTEISRYNAKINALTGQVAALRNREAAVERELAAAQARLDRERKQLRILRERLRRSLAALKERLVTIYKTGDPTAISIVLDSEGFDDALGRYEYLHRIQQENADIVGQVRELRNDTQETVDRVRETRDSIAARRDELARTRSRLETRERQLGSARAQSRRALGRIKGHVHNLEGDVSDIEKKIQAQLAAASGVPNLPAGPVRGGSAGFIWPVNGPVVSGFGPRWGRAHNGVDIAVPAGTPIRAAKGGQIALVQSEAESGGYGNFTCVDHGGGLSTCYAHQSRFAITSGSVSQGDVIGYVGCTGHCFGDHLHFEVRVNGVPVDPMGYL